MSEISIFHNLDRFVLMQGFDIDDEKPINDPLYRFNLSLILILR